MSKLSYMEIVLVIAEIIMGLVFLMGSILKSKKLIYPNEEMFRIKNEKEYLIKQRILYGLIGIFYIIIDKQMQHLAKIFVLFFLLKF